MLHRGKARGWLCALLLAGGLAPAGGTHAAGDIFHLSSGGRLEGVILSRDGGLIRIRTVMGAVSVTPDAIVRVEPGPSPFEEYDRRAAAAGETAADQFALAQWCGEQGLQRERLAHLRRAAALDSNYAPARHALGQIRIGELWVDGRSSGVQKPAAEGETDPERLAITIQANWRSRIAALRTTYLESSQERQVQEGRQRVAAIQDPLAIAPLALVLSEGNLLCRLVLVEALARFSEDVATVNLAALTLADPEREVRQAAIAELVRRADARITGQLRKALESGDDILIRRAAEALGTLRASEAVPDLVQVLRASQVKTIEVPVPRYFALLSEPYAPASMHVGTLLVPVQPVVAISNPAAAVELQRQTGRVTVYRTEVLEALRRITGQDFGFEPEAWARWYQEQR